MKVRIQISIYDSQHDWQANSEVEANVIAQPEAIAAMNWEAVCAGLVNKALADFTAIPADDSE